ncbi:MAG: helix-turn-helix transcriptional regulator [Lachnospiraceae bacterium]|nr:helix-turn-helix transcriptional regulator [Lachnospiraceae bacterium]
MTSDRIEIGKRIRNFRINNSLTQAQFAESLNVSTNFISEIETGKKNISQDTLCRICEHYHLSADYLLFGKTVSSTSAHTLSDFLSSLSLEDIPTVIDYLEAMMRIKKLDMKNSIKQ